MAAGGVRASRAETPLQGRELLRELETVGRSIRDPAAKLRYIRATLERRKQLGERVQAIPSSRLRRLAFRWLSLEHLRRSGPIDASARRTLRNTRGMVSAVALSLLAVATAVATTALQSVPPPPAAVAAERPALASVAEPLPALPTGVQPKAVWLVEKGEGYELWSNGLRIDTTHTVAGLPRYYHTFKRGSGMQSETLTEPAGLMFHTTESDIWPLEASFNENLRDSSLRLLRYLKRERVYHYLIDRFGRVYRVVDEASKANHAGHAVWNDGDRLYLSLNNAFLGISFETRWEGGRALPITEAQLTSGRSLTDYLRRRYSIEASMCVTHGITSVNPEKRLIGHHLDWARGFPFAAFGLPDQYVRPSPSVLEFGYGYDETLTNVLGEPWPGVVQAERALDVEAARRGVSVSELRHERQALYDAWRGEQLRDEQVARAAQAAPQATKASGG